MRYLRLSALLPLLALTACAGRIHAPAGGPGAPAAPAAVERFLQLAGQKDYVEMGWVFGTERGAVLQEWPVAEVERRMYALASLLQHDSFVVGSGRAVPGRVGAAMRFDVSLQQGQRRATVPFVVVQGPGQRWFVEQVEVEALTSPR